MKTKMKVSRLKKTAMPLYVEPETATALRALSERTRVPQQVFMREGIELVLAKYRRAK